MEQKQLDELDESFFGEEFIEDADESFPASTEMMEEEHMEVKEPELRLRKVRKTAAKKSMPKKMEKTAVEAKKEVVIEKVEKKASPKKEVKESKEEKKEAEIKPAKETKLVVETAPSVNPWAEDKSSGLFSQASTWKALTGMALVLLVLSVFTQGFNFADKGLSGAATATLSLEEAEGKTLSYVNTELLQPPFQATVSTSEELDALYRVTLDVGGQTVDSYVTKDGKLFFPQGFNMDKPKEAPDTELKPTEETTTPVMDVAVDDDPVLGEEDAPVVLVEFSDFQCPFCGKFSTETLPQLEEKYVKTGKVKLVYRDFPLEFHPEAELAAMAAECADEQGKFWEYHDVLFANQELLGDANYKKWAEDLGMDTEQFNGCYKGLKYLNEVRADMADGQKYGVSGTPAFFVNGKLISGAQPYTVFEQEIEAALAAAGKGSEEQEAVPEPTEAEVEAVPEQVPEEVEPSVPEGEAVKLSLNAKKWIFQPNEVTVKKGSKVVLTVIPTGLEFTFALPGLGVEQKVSGAMEIEFTADKTGSFDFVCSSCEEWRGMKGTLTVE